MWPPANINGACAWLVVYGSLRAESCEQGQSLLPGWCFCTACMKWMSLANQQQKTITNQQGPALKGHFDGVIAYMPTRLSNGVMEAINGLLQLAKRIARGFRNFHYFRLAAYLKAGGLNLQAPRLLPT